MRPENLEMEYFETYYWANIIHNILDDPYNYNYLGSLGPFFGEKTERFGIPFPKKSHLHEYITYMIHTIHFEDVDNVDFERIRTGKESLWVEGALLSYGFEFDSFEDWCKENGKIKKEATEDDLQSYFEELMISGPYEELLEKITNEVFFIIFMNRELLLKFNRLTADYIKEVIIQDLEEEKEFFKKDGILNRAYIPDWVQRAVFYRDRGICSNCDTDLTGIVRIGNNKNFDHIIPLVKGGANDVSNIQLLCEGCNKSKGGRSTETSKKYENWY